MQVETDTFILSLTGDVDKSNSTLRTANTLHSEGSDFPPDLVELVDGVPPPETPFPSSIRPPIFPPADHTSLWLGLDGTLESPDAIGQSQPLEEVVTISSEPMEVDVHVSLLYSIYISHYQIVLFLLFIWVPRHLLRCTGMSEDRKLCKETLRNFTGLHLKCWYFFHFNWRIQSFLTQWNYWFDSILLNRLRNPISAFFS